MIRLITSGLIPFSERAFAIISAIAILELIESLPPLKMQALPDLNVSPNASAVTLGLDS